MIKNTLSLPDNYSEIFKLDLQNDKKTALLVNAFSFFIFAVMLAFGHLHLPLSYLFDMSRGLSEYILRFAVMLAGVVVYIILHELVHGVFMRIYSKTRPKYGFTGLYAYAGSSAYYNKKCYIIIALSPVVIWGIIIDLINAFLPDLWFWPIYFIQTANISGAAGDLYVAFQFIKMPRDILVKDIGTSMTVYYKN